MPALGYSGPPRKRDETYANLSGPSCAIESGAGSPKPLKPDLEWLFTSSDSVGQLGHEELLELSVGPSAYQRCDEAASRGT